MFRPRNTTEKLVKKGADINSLHEGNTPLHIAAISENIDSISTLLNLRADITVLNNYDYTARDLLTSNLQLQFDIIVADMYQYNVEVMANIINDIPDLFPYDIPTLLPNLKVVFVLGK